MTDSGKVPAVVRLADHRLESARRGTGEMIIPETRSTDMVVWCRLPDLNSLDYFLRVLLKPQVYSVEIRGQII